MYLIMYCTKRGFESSFCSEKRESEGESKQCRFPSRYNLVYACVLGRWRKRMGTYGWQGGKYVRAWLREREGEGGTGRIAVKSGVRMGVGERCIGLQTGDVGEMKGEKQIYIYIYILGWWLSLQVIIQQFVLLIFFVVKKKNGEQQRLQNTAVDYWYGYG